MLAARVEPKNGLSIAGGPNASAASSVAAPLTSCSAIDCGARGPYLGGRPAALGRRSPCRRTEGRRDLRRVSVRHLCASFVDGDPARELMDRARMSPREFAPDRT